MAFCTRYMRFMSKDRSMLPLMDEKVTLDRLERDYDVEVGPKGALTTFMYEALEAKWDEAAFGEALDGYNEGLKHASYVATLAEEHGVQSPAQFVKDFSEDFIQHYCDNVHDDREVAELMLTFRGGSDWLDFEGYSRYGVEIMDMFCSACEEKKMRAEDEADDSEQEADDSEQEAHVDKKRRPGTIQVSVTPEVYREFCQFMAARCAP